MPATNTHWDRNTTGLDAFFNNKQPKLTVNSLDQIYIFFKVYLFICYTKGH